MSFAFGTRPPHLKWSRVYNGGPKKHPRSESRVWGIEIGLNIAYLMMTSFHWVKVVLVFVTEFGIQLERNEVFLCQGCALSEKVCLFFPFLIVAIVLFKSFETLLCA